MCRSELFRIDEPHVPAMELLQTGESVKTVVAKCFPTLTRAQVFECLANYEDHRGEIDLLVSRQMQTDA